MFPNALESTLAEARQISDAEWQKRWDALLDEQPHLMGFIINLADDFSESVHAELMRATVLLQEAFAKAGIRIGMVPSEGILTVAEEKVSEYETLNERDELDEENMERIARSPLVFAQMRDYMLEQLGDRMPVHAETRQNIYLILDVLIGLLEEYAVLDDEEPKAPDDV